jgi:tetratricopeptide (TPR) repeat protein
MNGVAWILENERNKMRLKLFWWFLILGASGAVNAFADESESADAKERDSTGSDDPDGLDTQAREAFSEAKALYNDGDYVNAAEKFREAYALKPTWKLLFNIGQCEAAAKRHGLAMEAFEQYLSLAGDDITPDRQELVAREMARLRPIVGFVTIAANPGAVVTIDGIYRGRTPLPGPLLVAAGKDHTAKIEIEAELVLERVVRVSGQQSITVDVEAELELDKAEEEEEEPQHEPPPVIPVQPRPAKQKSAKKTAGLATLGVGAALLVSGAVTGGLALAQFSELSDECPDNRCPSTNERDKAERADTLALATDILIPTGAVLGTLGVVLLVLSKKESESGSPVAFEPVVGPGQAGFVVEGRF